MNFVWKIYEHLTLKWSLWTLLGIALLVGAVLSYAPEFRLDASADSLVLENDQDLKYYRKVNAQYGSEDFLVITYSPSGEIFTDDALQTLRTLKNELLALEGISKIVTLLDVPLFRSPPIPFSEIVETARTLESPDIDYQLARREFLESPIYQELLLSNDGNTCVLLAYLKPDTQYHALLTERSRLRELSYGDQFDDEQKQLLTSVEKTFRDHHALHNERERLYIMQVREILDRYRGPDIIFLGGVPMIVADMISFIRSDMFNFGIVILLFLIGMLSVIFRQPRWVFLPLLTCGVTVAVMFGFLGLLDWQITVISANFASLLLIITMSMTIHIIVRYRETQEAFPNKNKQALIGPTMRFMLEPCFYTSLTTIAAFVSLFVSGIRPVIDFGHIMTTGIIIAFVLTFLLLPSILMLIPKGSSQVKQGITHAITMSFANFTHRHYLSITAGAIVIVVISCIGIIQLKVENRFIDYFQDDTEIYQGMLKIDQEMGGTVPLDLMLNAPLNKTEKVENTTSPEDDWETELLGDYLEETDDEQANLYWMTPINFQKIKEIHNYFENQPEIGKVLSLATLIKLSEQLNENKPLSDLQIPLLGKFLPESIRELLIAPYLSDDGDQLRFTMRIIDSDKTLKRQELIDRISTDIKEMGYDEEQFRLTGMLVLYNNMLQSLYQSQILTLGMVFLAILLMFVMLFRSLILAILAIIPSLLAASLVLGFMGWANIPLDIMTITIAAISIGIAVDNTIHYIVRFKREFNKDHDYFAAVKRCHGSIGKAVYYTSSIIIIGFATLSLSNFIPSMYFGMLVGLAMATALIGTLTLLPSLLLIIKPVKSLRI